MKAIDTVRFRLPAEQDDSDNEFWAAATTTPASEAERLFPDPVLTVVR